eukprot:3090240-Prymnesium_polylepis.2
MARRDDIVVDIDTAHTDTALLGHRAPHSLLGPCHTLLCHTLSLPGDLRLSHTHLLDLATLYFALLSLLGDLATHSFWGPCLTLGRWATDSTRTCAAASRRPCARASSRPAATTPSASATTAPTPPTFSCARLFASIAASLLPSPPRRATHRSAPTPQERTATRCKHAMAAPPRRVAAAASAKTRCVAVYIQ